MQNYYELYIYGVNSFEEDAVSSFLFDLGAGGVSQKLEFIQTAENFDPRILEQDVTDLVAYFEKLAVKGIFSICSFYRLF